MNGTEKQSHKWGRHSLIIHEACAQTSTEIYLQSDWSMFKTLITPPDFGQMEQNFDIMTLEARTLILHKFEVQKFFVSARF